MQCTKLSMKFQIYAIIQEEEIIESGIAVSQQIRKYETSNKWVNFVFLKINSGGQNGFFHNYNIIFF